MPPAPPKPVRVLVLEDEPKDAELMIERLRHGGYAPDWRRVESEADYKAALNPDLDLILADYTLPAFDGRRALALLKEAGLDVPFILVTGTIGEEEAVTLMLDGAFAAVLKDRLSGLAALVDRALEARAGRRDSRRAHWDLAEELEFRRTTEESMLSGLLVFDETGRIRHANPAAGRLFGLPPQRLVGMVPPFPFWPPEAAPELEPMFWSVLKTGKPLMGVETRVERGDGRRLDVRVEASPLRDAKGRVVGQVALIDDITAQKRADAERAFQLALLTTEHETSLDGILVVDETGRIVSRNRRFVEMWGLPPELAKDSDDEPVLRAVVAKVFRPGEFLERVQHLYANREERSQDEIALKDGRVFDRYSSPMVGTDGRYFGRVWYFRDITERRRAEERAARYSRALRTLSRGNEALIRSDSEQALLDTICRVVVGEGGYAMAWVAWRVDDEAKSVRPVAQAGIDAEYLRGLRVSWADSELGRGPTGTAIREGAVQVGRDFETDPRLAPWRAGALERGYRSSISLPLKPNGTVEGALTIASRLPDAFDADEMRLLTELADDVSFGLSDLRAHRARKDAELALHESERGLAEAQRMAHLGSWEWRIAADEVLWSDETYRIFGYPTERPRATYAAFLHAAHEEDRPQLERALREALERQQAFAADHRIVRPDGDVRFVHAEAELERDEAGRPLLLRGTIQDVTDRERSHRSLKEAQDRYRMIVENTSDMISMIDARGTFLYASPSHVRILGYAPQEMVGRPVREFVRPEQARNVLEVIDRSRMSPGATLVELEMRHKDGSWRWLEAGGAWQRDASGNAVQAVIVARDITERKRLEEQMRHAQRMETVGLLAGGVAHDFNNILMAILANCAFLAASLGPEDSHRAELQEIQDAAERAASLTRQLLIFSRKQTVQPVTLELNSLIRNLLKMLGRVVGEDVKLEASLTDGPLPIRADAGQIEQVVTNLVVNARDAMPQGGRLSLRTRPRGATAVLEVEDTGCGMPPQVLERLFEPFFTTKPAGKGTGLGLSTVYGIVRQFDGKVGAVSAVGKGTTFTVELPLAPPEEAPPPQPPPAPARAAGTETVLLVEDDPILRKIDERVLRESGYRVVPARDGEEALALLKHGAADADLLLTDVVMPGIGGVELAREAIKLRPGLPVIFVSGYIEHHALDEMTAGAYQLLQKPVKPDELVRKIRERLDRRPPLPR